MLDLLFHGASVVDGSGEPARIMDVGVKDGRITLNTAGKSARETVDATGLTLCPGFIDAHSHCDIGIGSVHNTLCKVSQGVTTEIGGQCGETAFPVDPRFLRELTGVMGNANLDLMPVETLENFQQFADYANSLDLAINMCSLVGHSSLRISVMGMADRAPTDAEMELMKERLRSAMEQGAMGLSSGLIYIPGAYSKTGELVELCKVMKPYSGIYTTHMRDEARNVVEAVREAIFIAEQAGVPLAISHHKVCGRAFWGKSSETLRLVEEALDRGVQIIMDQYPYEATMTVLRVCIPPKYFADGFPALANKLSDPKWREQIAAEIQDPDCGYDNSYLNSGGFSGILIVTSPNVPEAAGLTVAEYAQKVGKSEMDAYFDLLLANDFVGSSVFFSIDINEVERIYRHPRTVVGSDGECFGMDAKGHPRAWAAFVRPLREFAQEKKLVSFEQAVRKQTAMTADFWGLPRKGRIAEGCDADLVLLDRAKLHERATYQNSNQKADGIEAVYVLGNCVYRGKELTGIYPGRLLRRGE